MKEVNTECTLSGPGHCGKYSWCEGCYTAELRAEADDLGHQLANEHEAATLWSNKHTAAEAELDERRRHRGYYFEIATGDRTGSFDKTSASILALRDTIKRLRKLVTVKCENCAGFEGNRLDTIEIGEGPSGPITIRNLPKRPLKEMGLELETPEEPKPCDCERLRVELELAVAHRDSYYSALTKAELKLESNQIVLERVRGELSRLVDIANLDALPTSENPAGNGKCPKCDRLTVISSSPRYCYASDCGWCDNEPTRS